jgi:hypothetical protein
MRAGPAYGRAAGGRPLCCELAVLQRFQQRHDWINRHDLHPCSPPSRSRVRRGPVPFPVRAGGDRPCLHAVSRRALPLARSKRPALLARSSPCSPPFRKSRSTRAGPLPCASGRRPTLYGVPSAASRFAAAARLDQQARSSPGSPPSRSSAPGLLPEREKEGKKFLTAEIFVTEQNFVRLPAFMLGRY